MTDPFLDEIFVSNAIGAALSHNKIYEDSCSEECKLEFRRYVAKQLRNEAEQYREIVSESKHCAVIRKISCVVSDKFSRCLVSGRFRYGTAQKAFNLYLKFLWRSGEIRTPPHCPVDGVVLRRAGINDAWTRSDCEKQYLRWIEALKETAGTPDLGEWEHQVWLKERKGSQ